MSRVSRALVLAPSSAAARERVAYRRMAYRRAAYRRAATASPAHRQREPAASQITARASYRFIALGIGNGAYSAFLSQFVSQ